MSLALDDIQAFCSTSSGLGSQYQDAKLVLFTGGVSTGGCGNAPSSVGPFYCPADSKAYIDLSFFKELQSRFGAPGDFRSEEHTSELQSLMRISYAVFCLKKKTKTQTR